MVLIFAQRLVSQIGLASTSYVDAHAGGGLPSGMVTMILSGACPAGFTEAAGLDGKFLVGTLAAHGDVGTTGGSATITPTGTVSQPALTMNSYTPVGSVAAPTFTGSQATSSAVSAGTPAGTNGTAAFTPAGTITWPVGVPTHSGTAASFSGNLVTASGTTSSPKLLTANTSSGVAPQITATGSVSITSQGTIAWPAGVPSFTGSAGTVPAQIFTGSALATHTHTVTATGTNSAPAFTGQSATLTGAVSQPTFTGNALDPSPPYLKVIFCQAN